MLRCFGGMSVMVLLAAFMAGCSARSATPGFQPATLARQWPDRVEFRHKVRLEVPGMTVPGSFDGIMRLENNGGKPSIHVLGHGGMGLTLFDMTVTPDETSTAYLHPSLARVPHIEEHISRCVTSVWFDSLSLAARNGRTGREQFREEHRGRVVEHIFSDGRPELSCAPDHGWTVRLSAERPWPKSMRFENLNPEYTVHIRLIAPRTVEARKD